MSVPEAMACGRAVVSTDVGNVPVWSQDGSWVRVVPPGDPEALAAALSQLLDDPEERARLGAGARAAIEPFGWDRPTDVMEQALLRAVSRTSG